jgi:AraC-like DNA-binding protein
VLVLDSTTLYAGNGLQLFDVACRHPAGRGRDIEPAGELALVFVRRGCFVRSTPDGQALLDATLAYAMNPGEDQRFDHPHSHGDDCTVLSLSPDLVASLWGGEPVLPTEPIPVDPWLDLAHRALLAQAARRRDKQTTDDLHEQAIELGAGLLEAADTRRVASGRPSTTRRRRVLVDEARQALTDDPDLPLLGLAQTLCVSPHHLSRTFRLLTGETIARHRLRLRVRTVLERLGRGEHHLARLAADVGFSDQSHLCRAVRSETGATPSALRHALR